MPNNNNTQRFQEIAKKLKANLNDIDKMISSLEETDKSEKKILKNDKDAITKKCRHDKIKKIDDKTKEVHDKIKKVSEQIDKHHTQIEQYSKDFDQVFEKFKTDIEKSYGKLNKKEKKDLSRDLNDLLSEIK